MSESISPFEAATKSLGMSNLIVELKKEWDAVYAKLNSIQEDIKTAEKDLAEFLARLDDGDKDE